MDHSIVGIGVVGLGYWGPNLVRNFNEIEECRILKACDLKPGRRAFIERRYPHVGLTSDYRALLNDHSIDAICIVSPVTTHYKLAKEALLAGKDVFVEKPLAASVSEAEEMVALAEEKKRVLMVGHIFEYSPAVLTMKEIVERGDIGELYYMDSSRINLGPPASEVSVLWDLAPHDLSMMFFLTGLKPSQIRAVGKGYTRTTLEEMAYITVRFEGSEVLGHVHVSWLAPCKLRRTQVIGSKQVLVFDDTESVEKVKVFREGFDNRVSADDFGEFQLTYTRGDIHSPRLDNREPLQIECRHFVECIRTRSTPRSDGMSGLWVVRALEAAERSMRDMGQWESV